MTPASVRNWVADNQREILLIGLSMLAGWEFGRVAGRHEQR